MKSRRISIRNLTRILVSNYMAQIVKAEYQYKAQSIVDETKPIETNIMLKSIQSLNENVIFSDFVDWSYEKVSDTFNTEDFVVYGDLHDSTIGTVVVMHLKIINGFTVEDVENELNKTIFTELKENIRLKI